MILWRLIGSSQRESVQAAAPVVCSIEKRRCDYVLVVARADEVMLTEAHASLDRAKEKAGAFREDLIARGWIES